MFNTYFFELEKNKENIMVITGYLNSDIYYVLIPGFFVETFSNGRIVNILGTDSELYKMLINSYVANSNEF